jgi:hypothetical protein
MSLVTHAETELRLAGLFDKDSDYNGALGENVMELVRIFSAQGHSGCSAARVIQLFKKVAGYGVLTPIQDTEDSWGEVAEDLLQNKRDGRVFKNKKTGVAHYIDAIVWKTQKGSTWGGTADGVSSSQTIKSFPFIPKTFTIDVIEEEVVKDGWEFHIKNRDDLKQVREYYDLTEKGLEI